MVDDKQITKGLAIEHLKLLGIFYRSTLEMRPVGDVIIVIQFHPASLVQLLFVLLKKR